MVRHRLGAGRIGLQDRLGEGGVRKVSEDEIREVNRGGKESRELLRLCRPAGDTRELPGAMAPGSPGKAIERVARVRRAGRSRISASAAR